MTMPGSDGPLDMGPSFPYGMYPQNTMARSASITTDSVGRPPRISLSQPTHPYGMYPQNVMESPDEPAVSPIAAAIPVGFPGLNAGYHRRLGPDGEEQDIIGPDGHTEQLPPYSRYPEEGPTKAAMAAEASVSPIEAPLPATVPTPLPAPAPAPAPVPNSPVNDVTPPPLAPPLPQPPAIEERVSEAASSASTVDIAEQGISEKSKPSRRGKKKWGDKKLWGKIPLGLVIPLLILVLIFAIILGAVIGMVVVKGKKNNSKGRDSDKPQSQVANPTNSMFDASPIPVEPSQLPTLPTGTFVLPFGAPQESSPNCLTNPLQISAWSCRMTLMPLLLKVDLTVPEGNRPIMRWASIEQYTKPDGGVQYGVQPPTLRNNFLQLVLDQDYRAYKAAWHFQRAYDKIVVLAEQDISVEALSQKRDADGHRFNRGNGAGPPKPSFRHRFQVQPGDFPWYCIWNQTFIEGYIYVQDNSTAASFTGAPLFPTDSQSGANPSLTPTPTTDINIPASADAITSSATGPVRRDPQPTAGFYERGDGDYPRYLPYPRAVKIEERRLPDSPTPYCQKMQLTLENTLVYALDEQEQPIRVNLKESHPDWEEFFMPPTDQTGAAPGDNDSSSLTSTPTSDSGSIVPRVLAKRKDPADACHCQWMFQ